MLTNLVSYLVNQLSTTNKTATIRKTEAKPNNPFQAGSNLNPFLSTSFGTSATYGKNQPIEGGYFAGYYNGKPNIVGRRLFIEI